MHFPVIVAVTGGIGSGKSVVCRCLSAMGYAVYDCDSQAKQLMDHSEAIKLDIARKISTEAINSDGSICRQALSNIVFSDLEMLNRLNSIVHEAVKNDIREWIDSFKDSYHKIIFIETAILYQSGIDRMVDAVWEVTAPEELRIRRVCLRNSLSAEDVRKRIDSQSFVAEALHPRTLIISNDDKHSLLLQISEGLNAMR